MGRVSPPQKQFPTSRAKGGPVSRLGWQESSWADMSVSCPAVSTTKSVGPNVPAEDQMLYLGKHNSGTNRVHK